VAALALTFFASEVAAQDVVTTRIHNGMNAGKTKIGKDGRAKPGDQYYPGSEQSDLAQLANGQVVVLSMSSYTDIDNKVSAGPNGQGKRGEMQLLCVSGTVDANGAYNVTAMKHVTNNDGDRYRNANHPAARTILNGQYVMAFYNYADNNNNDAERMALALDGNCNIVGQQTQIFGNKEAGTNNDNFCETGQNSIVVHYDSPNSTLLGEGCGGNGNGKDDSWYYTVQATLQNGQVNFQYKDSVVTTNQEERTRPDVTLDPNDPGMAYVILNSGNNQCPKNGIRAYGIKVQQNGQVQKLWGQKIEEYDDNNPGTYSVQATATPLTGNNVAVTWYRVKQRRRRGKGRSEGVQQVVTMTPNGMQKIGQPELMSSYIAGIEPSHKAQINFGNGTFGVVSSSLNGNTTSQSTMNVMCSNNGAISAGPTMSLGESIDNAWLPNIYGNNPNTAGRNFISARMIYGGGAPGSPGAVPMMAMPVNVRDLGANGMPEDKLALKLTTVKATALACSGATGGVPYVPSQVSAPGAPGVDIGALGAGGAAGPGAPGGSVGGGLTGCNAGSSQGLGAFLLLGMTLITLRRRRRA